MSKYRLLPPLMVACLLAGTWSAADLDAVAHHQSGTPDVAAVRAVAIGIIEADNRGDVGQVMKHCAADAVLMPPGSAPVRGTAAVQQRYEALFQDFTAELIGQIDDVRVEGRLGIVRGHNSGRFVAKNGGQIRQVADVYVMVLQRDADDTWRISSLMWHPER